MTGKRRIDRILAQGYLEGLEDRSTDEIRRARDECEEEESGISFARRLLQGRLDIIRAEVLRRRDEGNDEAVSILGRLPTILGDEGGGTGPRSARATRYLVPPSVQYHRRDVDQIADDQSLANIRTRSLAELRELVAELSGKEQQLSRTRRVLLDRIDALQEELIRRYKSGAANVGEVLANRN